MKKYIETFTAIISVDVVAQSLLSELTPMLHESDQPSEADRAAHAKVIARAEIITTTIVDGLLGNAAAMSELLLNLQGWAKIESVAAAVVPYEEPSIVEQYQNKYFVMRNDAGTVINLGSKDNDKVYWKTGMSNTLASCKAGVDGISQIDSQLYHSILDTSYFLKTNSDGHISHVGDNYNENAKVVWYPGGSSNTLFFCDDKSRNDGRIRRVLFGEYARTLQTILNNEVY